MALALLVVVLVVVSALAPSGVLARRTGPHGETYSGWANDRFAVRQSQQERAPRKAERRADAVDKERYLHTFQHAVQSDAFGRRTDSAHLVAHYMAGRGGSYAGDNVVDGGTLPGERDHLASHEIRRQNDESKEHATKESALREVTNAIGSWWGRALGGKGRAKREEHASPNDTPEKKYEVGRVDADDPQVNRDLLFGDSSSTTVWEKLRERYQRKRLSPLLGIGKELASPLSSKCGHLGACMPYGYCNEETGICQCLPGFRGTFCKEEAFEKCIAVPGLVKVPCGSTAASCECRKQCYEAGVGMFNATPGCLVPPYMPEARDESFKEGVETRARASVSTSHVRRYEWRPGYAQYDNLTQMLTPALSANIERLENEFGVQLPMYYKPIWDDGDRSKWDERDEQMHTTMYDMQPEMEKSGRRLWDYDLVDCETPTDVETCDYNAHRSLYYMVGNETFTHWKRWMRPGSDQPRDEYIERDMWMHDRTKVAGPIKPLRNAKACGAHLCRSRGYCVADLDTQATACECFPGFTGPDCGHHDPLCVNDCSTYGTCASGTCNCTVGAYGADCSLPMFQSLPEDPDEAQQKEIFKFKENLKGEAALNVYIYDLPPHLSTEIFSQQGYGVSWAADTSYAMEVRLWETMLRDVNTRVTHLTIGSDYPNDADFYFVPLLQMANGNGFDGMDWEYVNRVMEWIEQKFPKIAKKNSFADHVVPFAGNVGACRAFAGPIGRDAIRLSHWGMMRDGTGASGNQDKTAETAVPAYLPSFGGDCHRKGKDIVLPPVKDWRQDRYKGMLERLRDGKTSRGNVVDKPMYAFGRLEMLEPELTERDYSLGMQQQLGKYFTNQSYDDYEALVEQLKKDNEPGNSVQLRERLYLIKDQKGEGHTLSGAVNDNGVPGVSTEHMHELYSKSTFCLTTVRRGWNIEFVEIILNDW